MRSIVRGSVLALIFVAVGLFAQPVDAQIEKEVLQFVGDVIVRSEYGTRDIDFVKRWTRSPTLSTFGEGDQFPRVIKSVVDQINELLPDDIQITVLEPGDESADIKVIFTAREKFQELAKKHEFTLPEGVVAYFSNWWNGKFELKKAIVLIPSDKKYGRELRHIIMEEISQSMGAGGDSSQFEKSVFYEDLDAEEYGSAVKFSKLDKRLIKFLYQHVPPGASGVEVGYLLAKHWEEAD